MVLQFEDKRPTVDAFVDGEAKHFQARDTATGKQVVRHVPYAVWEALGNDDPRMKRLGYQKFLKAGGGLREVTLDMDDLGSSS